MDSSKRWAGAYSVVFLLRRSLFVLITFVYYRGPSSQVQVMTTMTLVYICFLGHVRIHESRHLSRIEMLNEYILLCLSYHFIYFIDPAWSFDFKDRVGDSAVVFVSLILGINTVIIIAVNIASIRRKLHLRFLRKKAEKQRAD